MYGMEIEADTQLCKPRQFSQRGEIGREQEMSAQLVCVLLVLWQQDKFQTPLRSELVISCHGTTGLEIQWDSALEEIRITKGLESAD